MLLLCYCLFHTCDFNIQQAASPFLSDLFTYYFPSPIHSFFKSIEHPIHSVFPSLLLLIVAGVGP